MQTVSHAVSEGTVVNDTGPEKAFLFVGNAKCLDFVNTELIVKGRPVDLLENFGNLVSWLAETQALDAAEAREAVRRWGGRPEGARVFAEGRAFRAVLRAMVERVVNGKPVQSPALDAINKLLQNRVGYSQLVRERGGFGRRFHSGSVEAIHLLVPLAEFASDLLCHYDQALIKRCQNPACILYFYDTTKNHARRWCSMSICGNRIKVAAHYSRHRAKS
nr:CGNR zinc finger domain-containing protein [Nitrospirota bacterium]